MNKEIIETASREITRLHEELTAATRKSFETAIRIGELLTEEKRRLKHGEWLEWCKTNLAFTDRTASAYMRLFENRDRLKSETASDLSAAYKLLAAPEQTEMTREEAEAATAVVKMHFAEMDAIICRLEQVKLDRSWPEEYAAFEDFLIASGVSLDEFRRSFELYQSMLAGETGWMRGKF